MTQCVLEGLNRSFSYAFHSPQIHAFVEDFYSHFVSFVLRLFGKLCPCACSKDFHKVILSLYVSAILQNKIYVCEHRETYLLRCECTNARLMLLRHSVRALFSACQSSQRAAADPLNEEHHHRPGGVFVPQFSSWVVRYTVETKNKLHFVIFLVRVYGLKHKLSQSACGEIIRKIEIKQKIVMHFYP